MEKHAEKDMEKISDDEFKQLRLYKGIDTKYIVYIICAILLLVLISFIVSYKRMSLNSFGAYDPARTDKYLDEPEQLKQAYNTNIMFAPFFLRWMIGDERVNVSFTRLDESIAALAITTDNGMIKDIKKGQMEKPTMHLIANEATLEIIYESDDPIEEFEQAVKKDDIKAESLSFLTSIKLAILKITIAVLSLFG